MKARLTAASGRAPIYPARVRDTALTAERPWRGVCSRLVAVTGAVE